MSPPLETFHPLIARWFTGRLGEPTEVQKRSWPSIAAGRHVLVSAPTGTGKTLAYLLPGMTRLLSRPAGGDTRPRMLVVTPTRELAAQVAAHATDLGRYTRLRVVAVYGGESMGAQIRALVEEVRNLARKDP